MPRSTQAHSATPTEYLGFNGKIHHTARTQYHNIPSWDFYRSLVPLLTITAPDVASDLAQSLVSDAQQDPGGGMPRWVHAATDSCGMFGDAVPKSWPRPMLSVPGTSTLSGR
jgi:putative alpha-1,2-mannosidase